MPSLFNPNAPKKPINLRINSDLLEKSKALNINLSATLEAALEKRLAEAATNHWQQANKDAIQIYNEVVEERGLFSDDYRAF